MPLNSTFVPVERSSCGLQVNVQESEPVDPVQYRLNLLQVIYGITRLVSCKGPEKYRLACNTTQTKESAQPV